MKFWWEDFNPQKHKEIDKWRSSDIDNFAMFGESLSKQALWYRKNKLGKDADFIKIVSTPDQIVAFMILNLSGRELGINPIVVNPTLIGKGYGKEVLLELIGNYREILGVQIDVLSANISMNNIKSIKFFESLGFTLNKLNDDKDFGSYVKQTGKPE